MAYTLSQGVGAEGLDRTQRGLLVGLPALILALTIGALLHHGTPNSPAAGGAKVIPIVSTIKTSSGNPGADSSDASSKGIAAATSAPVGSSANLNSGSISSSGGSAGGGTTSSGGGSGGVVGGRGGGPTGGGATGGGTTGGTGGAVSIPDCSLNQIATVNCRVPACSPEVSLAPGQKAILGLAGTCIVVN